MSQSLKPLQGTLESILGRLAILESKAGIVSPVDASTAVAPATAAADDDGEFVIIDNR